VVKDQYDHDLLILDSREIPVANKNREFKFDTSWLKHNDFLDMVKNIWLYPEKYEPY
jgi:hypothetical protein